MALAATLGEAPPKISMSDRPATKKFSARPLYQFNSCGGRADAAVGPVAPLLARRGTHSQYGTSERASAGGHAASVRVARLLPIPVLLSLLPSFLLSRLFGSLLLRLRKERSEEGGALSGDKPPQRQSEDPNGREAAPTFFPIRSASHVYAMYYTTLHCTVPLVSHRLLCFAAFAFVKGTSERERRRRGLKKQMNGVKMQCISGNHSVIRWLLA